MMMEDVPACVSADGVAWFRVSFRSVSVIPASLDLIVPALVRGHMAAMGHVRS
jgi:hypothetical protein